MTADLHKEVLNTLRRSPANEWPQIERDIQRAITQAVLCQESDLAGAGAAARYFGPPRFPGTTSIGYRQRNPEIFQDTTESTRETYPDWVHRSVAKILRRMEANDLLPPGVDLGGDYAAMIVQKIGEMLAFETRDGVPFREAIPQQMYEDVFIRMVALLIKDEAPGETIGFYREFNAVCHRIAMALIDRLENDGAIGMRPFQIGRLVQIAVLSGYVGINLKSSASAASTLLNRNYVPLNEGWIRSIDAANAVSMDEIDRVVENLLAVSERAEGQFGLESLGQYQEEIIQTSIPTLLVFFADDYLESIVDMKRFEVMLDANDSLTVLFVPRNGRYGNDIAYEDTDSILRERQFNDLQKHLASGRFHVSEHGPRSGCIDPRCIAAGLINEIGTLSRDKRVVFETKGCRNFEMLRGNLQVPWYAGFNCNRALSIRTVGVDGPPVFLRVPPGLRAYDRFTQPAIGPSPSYQTAQVRFARMTTKQLYAALDSELYRALLDLSADELSLNSALTQLGDSLDITFSELTALLETFQLKD